MRFLQAWMPREEAIANSLGRSEMPADDVTQFASRWEAARRALDARPPYNGDAPQLEALPLALAERAEKFRQRSDVVSAFQNLNWTLGIADLDCVLSLQKSIVADQAADRVAGIDPGDIEALFSACLPDPAPPTDIECIVDPDHRGLTFFSPNPNLRLGRQAFQQKPAGPGQSVPLLDLSGFALSLGLPFIQIGEFGGRWFVRDGYHRCYGFLRRGIRRIPCVLIRARSFEELAGTPSSFIRQEVLFGPRPPYLKDFLDDELSATALRRNIRKVVRISAQEFLIQI